MKSVEEEIKAYYTSKSLSLEQLIQLKSQSKVLQRKRLIRQGYKYAAVFVIALCTAYGVYFLAKERESTLIYAFAKEVAFNHQKQAVSEFKTADVNVLSTEMTQLDFTVAIPQGILQHYSLIGGRYCAIDNRVAAQLKMKTHEGAIVTLYIFKKKEFFAFHENIKFDTTAVTIWDDNALIYALASE